MTKLTEKVINAGMCSKCGDVTVTSISHKEATMAIATVKQACIDAVNECLPYESGIRRMIVEVIRDVK